MAFSRPFRNSAPPSILAKSMDISMDHVRRFPKPPISNSFNVLYSYLHPDWGWYDGYDTFRELKSDVFLVASPGSLIAWIASPEVITQVTKHGSDFPKP